MEKNEQIKEIKRILKENGTTTAGELQLDCSPLIGSLGNGLNSTIQLAEHFNLNTVTAVTYYRDQEMGEEEIAYEDLPDDVINEIYEIMLEYDADEYKTMKRCED